EEILSLEKAYISLERGSMSIRHGKTAAARRTLRLTTESRDILARRLADNSSSKWVFPSRKRPAKPIGKLQGSHEKALELTRICKECGRLQMEHTKHGCKFQPSAKRLEFVLYDFRHTFATRAAESGMPIATLAAILGHADLRSITKYVHVGQEAKDIAMAEFEQKTIAAQAAMEKWQAIQ